jgi:hypothetical protein
MAHKAHPAKNKADDTLDLMTVEKGCHLALYDLELSRFPLG